jgi:hypothetical protein
VLIKIIRWWVKATTPCKNKAAKVVIPNEISVAGIRAYRLLHAWDFNNFYQTVINILLIMPAMA